MIHSNFIANVMQTFCFHMPNIVGVIICYLSSLHSMEVKDRVKVVVNPKTTKFYNGIARANKISIPHS